MMAQRHARPDVPATSSASAVSAATAGIWAVMRPVMPRVRWAMGLSVLATVAGLSAVVALTRVIAALLPPDPAPQAAWPWVGLAAALTVAAFVLRLQASKVAHLAAFRLETVLRTELAEHLARLPLGVVLAQGAGRLTKVMQDDVRNLHAFVADSTPLLARGVAAPLLTLALLLAIDWRLALLCLLVLGAGMAAVRLAMGNHAGLQREYDDAHEQVNQAVVAFVQAMPVVRTFDDGSRSFGRYQAALAAFHAVLARWIAASARSAKLGIVLLGPLPTLLAVLAGGLWLWQHGRIDFAAWMAGLLLGCGMAEALLPLMWLSNFLRKADASARRIQALLALPPLPVPAAAEADAARVPQDASVCFEAVDFHYAGQDQPTLSQVSFTVPAGSVTALVGPSGAGKSTVARLIGRFWDVDVDGDGDRHGGRRGAVRIGGVDVRDLSPETLMAQVSWVFQDAFLFHDTLAANIRLGCPGADDAAVVAAARAAQAHDFIMALPQGYATRAGERGARLSGGQRQRITVARAILQNRPIVVLDEATAATDAESEAALLAALAHLMRGRTVILIAHRLTTLCDADQIVVLERGRVVECGRHAGLLERGGLYARLWRHQQAARHWSLRRADALAEGDVADAGRAEGTGADAMPAADAGARRS